ncbi:thiamine pyrophosphate-dependent dehydrogenase E1 component subunit alpha [Thermodesulfobacteriota bacterium]
MPVNNEDLKMMFRKMLTIRRFEERAIQEYQEGNIYGFIHSYIGQEAIAAGVCCHLRVDDRIVSNHRGHGHCIAKGADMKRMMAEIFGKKTGYCGGKGGSMHIADFEIGMLGANGIVGAGLPIATGSALAAQLEGKEGVSIVFFGDGACGEGEFHESLNLASIWKLPIVFVCENNMYGVNTPTSYSMATENVADRAAAYSMPGEVADGNNLLTVYETAERAVKRARAGEGPSLIEFRTYRWRGHFEGGGMPDLRPLDELEEWKKKCPVAFMERQLRESGIMDTDELRTLDVEIMSLVQEAVEFARQSPDPDPADALEDIFAE